MLFKTNGFPCRQDDNPLGPVYNVRGAVRLQVERLVFKGMTELI